MKRLIPALAAACLFASSVLWAEAKPFRLDPTRPMEDYVLASWRDNTGLPVDSVTSVAQTPDGYLWLGTEQGLVRFDGVRFTTFNRRNVSAFRTNEIYTLFVSSDGTLWIGTRGGGALTWDGTAFRRVPIPNTFVVAFAESRDGAVWLGAPAAVVRYRDGEYTAFGKGEGYPGGRLYAMAADSDGAYVAVGSNVHRLSSGGAREWTPADGLPGGEISAILMSSRGLLAADDGGRIVRLSGDRFVEELRIPGAHPVSSMREGADQSIWMTTIGGGIVRFHRGDLSYLTEEDGLTSNSLNQLLEDEEGNLWAGTTGGGLVRIIEGRLATVTPPQRLSGEWILPLIQARDGSVWFATNGGGLYHMTDDRLSRITTADGLGHTAVTALTEGLDGAIWVAHHEGLQRIENGRITRTFTVADGLLKSQMYALWTARDGSILASGSGALYRIANDEIERIGGDLVTASGPIVAIREATDGALWLAKPDAIERFHGGTIRRFSREQGLSTKSLYSITLDENDGSIWAVTMMNGIARIRDGRVRMYDSGDGLLTDTAYTVLLDHEGDPWISTNVGLYTIERSSFDRFDNGEIANLPITVFRKSDGLKSSDFSGGFDRAGFRAADDTLWFPTTRGLVVVDPRNLRVSTSPPRVAIESIVENGLNHGSRTALIEAPRGKRTFEIDYTSPQFRSPESVSFQYRLVGFDEGWHEAGARRTAYYTNVPPGRYTFVVRAMTPAGLWREANASIEVVPRFYETWPFRIACLLALLLALQMAYRRRLAKMQRHERELRKSQEHFRSLIENAPDMLIIVDRLGRIAYASRSVEQTLGATPRIKPGREMRELFVEPAVCDRFLGEVRKHGLQTLTHDFHDADGSTREIEIVGATAAHSNEVVLNCRDITDRRRLESKLEQAHRLSSLGRLAATVSHEFNNVLMGIQPFVEIIRRKSDDAGVHNATVRIAQSVARGKRISEEILRFTRPVEPSLSVTPVRPWLLEMEAEIRALLGPAVQFAIIAPEELAIEADLSQLNQVLTNMAINARDAGSTSVRIEVRSGETNHDFEFGIVNEPERLAHILFCDNGGGIPAAALPHIFEPLFTTKKTKGTGLGLAVAHQVITAHGGELFVETRTSVGTTFHIFLPLARSATGELMAGRDELESSEAPAACRVLLVEDDATVADGVIVLLEIEGFTVAHAANGGDALSMIPRVAPDVVIVDVGLPDIDGVELYHRIARQWPQIRVIFSTGHGDFESLGQKISPVPTHLRKPYTVEELLAAIAEAREPKGAVV